MRSLSASMRRKVASRIQAGENGMSASLWVGRPTTPLTDDSFLEKQTVLYSSNITKASMAVCHPNLSRGATTVYIAYIDSGELKVTKAQYTDVMDRHIWEPVEFSEWAEDVSICFDGTMPKAPSGWVEFKTEEDPWVFWCLNGVLYGKKLYDAGDPLVLAEANCSAVSSVRAMWSSHGGFDFGLVIFFLLNGQLYYRQLINGEWMDAEVVSFGPAGVKWEDIAAFRTWDYRIGIQGKSTDGAYYEMFTQFMGIGKQNTEHIESQITADAILTGIKYSDAVETEHIESVIQPVGQRIYAWSSVPVSAKNLDDGTGNWGFLVHVTLDYPVTNVGSNSGAFFLADSDGVSYPCVDAKSSEDGLILQLTFLDFNLSEGKELTVAYTPGTVQSPAVPLEAFEFTFTPEGLVAPNIPVPEPVEAHNLDAEGTKVAIKFTERLVGDITGYDTPAGYKQQTINLSEATVSTLNQYSNSYSGAKAIDGNTSTYWYGTTTSNWISIQLKEPKAVTGLRLITASYYIKTFTLSGSNDGATWTQLGGTYAVGNPSSGVWNTFSVDNSTPYNHYRIDVLTGSSRIYLYELDLQETVAVGNETKVQVSGPVYRYVPGGVLFTETRKVTEVGLDPADDRTLILSFAPGNESSIRNMAGDVTIAYSGGTLRGLGGPVIDFSLTFTPVGLDPKNHPNGEEHIESNIIPSGTLKRIYYSSVSGIENLEASIQPSGVLTSISDL